MKKCLGNWWTTTISLDEELKILENKVDHLKALESDNLMALENELIQPGKKQKRQFEFWLTNVQNKKSKYWQIENELSELWHTKNMKSRIQKEIKEVEELIQQGKFPTGIVLDDHASRRLPMVTTSLVGRRCAENVETILKLLKEDGVFAIGVHGMGGVGKTTIVKEIHNRLLLDSDNAGQVYWVTASQDCSLEKLQNDIGKVVGLHDFSKEDNERKKALLYQRFSMLENSVLIIDDLWGSYVIEKIGILLESCGWKIVITTRKMEVCKRLPCQRIIRIVPLDEADSWTVFTGKLGELPSDVKDIAVKIVQECGGLPLALITMGCCMRGIADVCEWENALYELRKPARRQDLMEVEVFRILKFSFDMLKDYNVQDCFLSCVLFPEDRVINEVELVDLWINEGLLDDMENQHDRVNKGRVILNRLMKACLLERGSDVVDGWVKMHDLIRDMGIIITRERPLFIAEAGKQLKHLPELKKWSKDLVKVSLSDNKIEKIPSAVAPIMTPNLTVLMLNRNPLKEVPNSFFVHMRALTVLDLSRTAVERVPESVSDLENLKGLLLVECEELIYVPSVAKLTKLRVLDLVGCDKLKEAPRGLERLESVEKLSYIPWDVSDLAGFNEVVQRLTSLSSFGFFIRDPNSFLAPNSSKWELIFKTRKVMRICGGEYGGDKSNILVPATLEYLAICGSQMKGTSLGDVFLSLGKAMVLKGLDINDCKGLEYVLDSSGTKQGGSLFCTTKLESLLLDRLTDFRSIAKLRMPQSFSQLRDLCICDCPKLKVVVPVTCTKQLLFPNLEGLRVEFCDEVEEIFETNKATTSSKCNPILDLPKLKELTLKFLPKIKVIFPFTEKILLPNLQEIVVSYCEELEEMVETNKATPSASSFLSLPNLKKLTLISLPAMKAIFPFKEELRLPNLKSIDVGSCEELKEIFKQNHCVELSILSFSKLKDLDLNNLSELGIIYYRSLLLCASRIKSKEDLFNFPRLNRWGPKMNYVH